MTVTIDTNILLHLLRGTPVVSAIQKILQELNAEDTIVLSIASVGEIESIAHQRNYGKQKRDYLKKLRVCHW
jgi:predicted nucleic acid-binding protein